MLQSIPSKADGGGRRDSTDKVCEMLHRLLGDNIVILLKLHINYKVDEENSAQKNPPSPPLPKRPAYNNLTTTPTLS